MIKILHLTCFGAALFLVSACKKSLFGDLPPMEPVPQGWMLNNLRLPETYDYVELRLSYGPWESYYYVQDSTGIKCGDAVPDCATRFDTIRTYKTSFGKSCLPGYCDRYLVTRQGNTIRSWVGLDELASWLGPVDSTGDALLWGYANGYRFKTGDPKNSGVIRLKDGTFYVIALRLVKDCMPVQTDRFLLEVHPSGRIKVLDQKLYHQSGGCI